MTQYQYDWNAVRSLWEAGEAANAIAKKEGMPSKQAICMRAHNESWQKVDAIDVELEVIPFEGLSDAQRIVIKEMARGLPQKWAGSIAGVTEQTVSEWKKDDRFRTAAQAAIGVMARRQLGKITESEDWRSGLALLERHPATRDDFAPANAQRGMVGTTFNVLGHVNLGFDRAESLPAPELGSIVDGGSIIDQRSQGPGTRS